MLSASLSPCSQICSLTVPASQLHQPLISGVSAALTLPSAGPGDHSSYPRGITGSASGKKRCSGRGRQVRGELAVPHPSVRTALTPCSLPLFPTCPVGQGGMCQTSTYGRPGQGAFRIRGLPSTKPCLSCSHHSCLCGWGPRSGEAQRSPDNRASGRIPHTHGGRERGFVSSPCLPRWRGQALPSAPRRSFVPSLPARGETGR